MRTTIGQTLHDSPRLAVAGLIGALAVAADFALEWWSKELHYLNAAEGRVRWRYSDWPPTSTSCKAT